MFYFTIYLRHFLLRLSIIVSRRSFYFSVCPDIDTRARFQFQYSCFHRQMFDQYKSNLPSPLRIRRTYSVNSCNLLYILYSRYIRRLSCWQVKWSNTKQPLYFWSREPRIVFSYREIQKLWFRYAEKIIGLFPITFWTERIVMLPVFFLVTPNPMYIFLHKKALSDFSKSAT